jgi:hypothetical protein
MPVVKNLAGASADYSAFPGRQINDKSCDVVCEVAVPDEVRYFMIQLIEEESRGCTLMGKQA